MMLQHKEKGFRNSHVYVLLFEKLKKEKPKTNLSASENCLIAPSAMYFSSEKTQL